MRTQSKHSTSAEIEDALGLILILAEGNITDRLDNPGEYRRQMKAIKLVRETFGILD
jgi:hypothetical protein